MNKPAANVLLYSGGLDSLIAWEYLRAQGITDIKRVYAHLGHRYGAHESLTLPKDVEVMHNLDLGAYELPNAFIPARNMFLAMLAALHLPANGGRIWLSVQKHEQTIPDRKKPAFNKMGRALSLAYGAKISVHSPFWEMTKAEMVRWFLDNVEEDPAEQLRRAWSCYSPPPVESAEEPLQHCGHCAACVRKFIALSVPGISTEGIFAKHPPSSNTARTYVQKAMAGEYPADRAQEILEHLL